MDYPAKNQLIPAMSQLQWIRLLLIILIEGFVTISAEILSLRELIPFTGNDVIVTSLIIGVFLLFLAAGYQRGGFYQRNYTAVLKRNFLLAAFIFSFCFSFPFLYYFFTILQTIVQLNLYIVLTIYLLLVMAPLVYILGQTVPITTNFFEATTHIGKISGKVLALSTIGSFLGAILTALIFMNFFGTAATVCINFLLLGILFFMLVEDFSANNVIQIMAMLCFAVLAYSLNILFDKHYFNATTVYGNYRVLPVFNFESRVSGRLLEINNSASSFLDVHQQGSGMMETIKHIVFDELKLTQRDILVLGAGGFSFSAEKTQDNHVTYVDIDPDIKRIAQLHFNKHIRGQFIAQDARSFLLHNKQNYDVIIADVYSNRMTIPFHLVTAEYFTLLRSRLKPNGTAILNIIANPTYQDAYSNKIYNTISHAFGACNIVPIHYHNAPSNMIFICSRHPISASFYTDDLNQAPLDMAKRGETYA